MLLAQTGWSSKRWLMKPISKAQLLPTWLPPTLRAKVAVHPAVIAVVVAAAMTVPADLVVAVAAVMIAVAVVAVTMMAAKS